MSRKFRIFAPMLGFDPGSSLGGEIYDVEVLTRLAKRGHTIDVVLRKGQNAPKAENIHIHFLPLNMKTWVYSTMILPWLFRTKRMKELIRKADVFRVHSPYFLGLGAVLARSGKPLWFNYHHIEGKPEMMLFDRFLPKRADGITFVSEETKNDLGKICDIGDKITGIASTAIDTGTFRPVKTELRKRLGIGEKEKIILFVGALIPRKGLDVLLESWGILRKKYDDIHLIIIGKGPLEKLIPRDERIHHIKYAGSRESLVEYYNAADVFAFPTRLEGFGMAAGEAMACETPVVTTRAKGVRNLVDNETGFRVEVDDVKAFTKCIETLLNDENLRKEMGKKARKRIRENFTWEKTVDETEKFLRRLVRNA